VVGFDNMHLLLCPQNIMALGHLISCSIFIQLLERCFLLFALHYFYGSKVCLYRNIEPLFLFTGADGII